MKVFAVGSSRNIGYYTATGLLKQGHTVIFLVRNPTVFDDDEEVKSYIYSGKAMVVKGDALVPEQVQSAWQEANSEGAVDLVVFSVGGTPKFYLTKGFVTSPPDLCTTSLINVLSVLPINASEQPRVVIVTSHGIIDTSHQELPLPVKAFHTLLNTPHADKLGMERIIDYTGGWASWAQGEPSEVVLPSGWEARLGRKEGWLKAIAVVRPALLTDGAEKGKYRVGEKLPGTYTISRRDVAHFIVNGLVPNWEKYEGKGVSVGY